MFTCIVLNLSGLIVFAVFSGELCGFLEPLYLIIVYLFRCFVVCAKLSLELASC
jgi:hypothetical protein